MTRRTSRRAVPLCVLLVGLTAGVSVPVAPDAHAHAVPAAHGSADRPKQSSSRLLRVDGSLSDVAALAGRGIWAVGQEGIWDAWQSRGVLIRWDGGAWSKLGIRNDPSGAAQLRSIAASGGELWAVGEAHDGLPYVVRGDGNVFDRTQVPVLRAGDRLHGVATGRGRVAAVGSRGRQPLIVSGDGTRWSVATRDVTGTLYGVALASAKEGWAVGDTGTAPLIMRLGKSGWKPVAAPKIRGGYLRDVHADGGKRAVAIGGIYRDGRTVDPLVLQWNGKRWSRMRVPDRDVELYGVTGDGKGRYWISGFDSRRPGEGFLLRYADGKWKIIRGEAGAGERTVRLQGVTRSGDTVVAVGHVVDEAYRYTDVIETLEQAPAR